MGSYRLVISGQFLALVSREYAFPVWYSPTQGAQNDCGFRINEIHPSITNTVHLYVHTHVWPHHDICVSSTAKVIVCSDIISVYEQRIMHACHLYI